MESNEIFFDDELQHWGIKGQKWGVRRYQNKDGSLTKAGQKRYNKEMEALKKEKAKVKAEEKVLANKKKTQAKIDKLEAEKKALEERKKALKDEQSGKKPKESDKPGETPEQIRERVLNSSDAKEIYKNKDLLTYNEINDRINRIDMEAKLKSRIAEEPSKYDVVKDKIEKVTEMYKTIDNAYSAVSNSSIGKTLAKKIGIDTKESSEFNLADFAKNINKKSAKEIKEVADRLKNEKSITDEYNKRENKKKADEAYAKKQAEEAKAAKKAEKEAKKAKKQVDGDSVKDFNDNSDRGSDKNDSSYKSKPKGDNDTERYEGTVEGEGTSKSSIKEDYDNARKSNTSSSKSSDYYEPVDMPMNNVPATTNNRGQSYVAGYLESKGNDDFKYIERRRDGDDWTYIYDDDR